MSDLFHFMLATSYPVEPAFIILVLAGIFAAAVCTVLTLIAVFLMICRHALPDACRACRAAVRTGLAALVFMIAAAALFVLGTGSISDSKHFWREMRYAIIVILCFLPFPLIAIAVAAGCRRMNQRGSPSSAVETPRHTA